MTRICLGPYSAASPLVAYHKQAPSVRDGEKKVARGPARCQSAKCLKTRDTHICNSAFRSIIPHQARPRSNRPNTRNVDYCASTPLLQRRHRGRNTEKHALDIHGETLVELRLRHLCRRLIPIARACVVDHDIQSAELLLGCTNERLPRVSFGDAACDGGDVVGEEEKCFARPSPFMSAATTLQPSETKRLVIARPKPDAAPV